MNWFGLVIGLVTLGVSARSLFSRSVRAGHEERNARHIRSWYHALRIGEPSASEASRNTLIWSVGGVLMGSLFVIGSLVQWLM